MNFFNSTSASIALALVLLTACGGKSSSPSAPAPQVKSQESGPEACANFIAKLPPDYFHDYITVPEDPHNPSGNLIKVFYYGKLIPGKTPVVFFNGGPTSNSWGSYQVLTENRLSNSQYSDIPFIFIDQRGTGCSDAYPELHSSSDLARLALYGSAGIVADAEAVRKKLIGDAPWKVFGQSYGGMVVHRYIQLAPQSIVSATSHGFALTNDPMKTLTERVDSQNRVLTAYLAKYPDSAELTQLNQLLTPTTCFSPSEGKGKSCGKNILNPLLDMLGFVDDWPLLHKWLVFLAKTPNVISQQWIDKMVFNPSSVGTNTQDWADEVIWHNEMNFATTTSAHCQSAFVTLTLQEEDPTHWLLDQCQSSIESPHAESEWDAIVASLPQNLMLPDDLKTILTANPKLKLYLYSGGIDPYSPVEIFQDEIAAAGNLIQYAHLPHSGHDGFYTEDLVWQNLSKD